MLTLQAYNQINEIKDR